MLDIYDLQSISEAASIKKHNELTVRRAVKTKSSQKRKVVRGRRGAALRKGLIGVKMERKLAHF